jgi:hypothetical protein
MMNAIAKIAAAKKRKKIVPKLLPMFQPPKAKSSG